MNIFEKVFKRSRKQRTNQSDQPTTQPARNLTILANCQFYSKSSVLPNIEQVVVTGVPSYTTKVMSALEDTISNRVAKLQGMKGYKAMIIAITNITDDAEYLARVNSRSKSFKFTSPIPFNLNASSAETK